MRLQLLLLLLLGARCQRRVATVPPPEVRPFRLIANVAALWRRKEVAAEGKRIAAERSPFDDRHNMVYMMCVVFLLHVEASNSTTFLSTLITPMRRTELHTRRY